MTVWLLNAAPWIGLALATVGLMGTLWALSPWPRSARRRCPRCWYDMSGAPASLRCPECGRTAKSERRLQRRRRRWRMAFLGVFVMVLGGAAAATPDVVRGTWPRLVPTSVLYATMDWQDDKSIEELERRFRPNWNRFRGSDESFWSGWPLHVESVLLRPLAKANIRNPARGDDAVFAIHCLQAVGVREDDLPLLALHLTPASDPWTRHLAAEAVAQLGPKAAPVLPQLCECIAASSSHGLPTAELLAIKAMGPAAAPAIEYLRLSLWTPFRTYSLSEDPRRTVIEAAGAIGPPAASLAPEMLELAEDAPHLRVPITAALIRIMPDDPMVYTWALEVLNSPDVAAHGLIDEALFSAPTLRGQLINTLRAQAHDQQSCIRLAAVRAMLSMWVPPRLEDTPLARDLERPVRLLAERWMHASSVRSLPETTSAHPDPHKGQTR